jgi:hypothetical protein
MAIKNRTILQILLGVFILSTLLSGFPIDNAQAAPVQANPSNARREFSCRQPDGLEEWVYCKSIEQKILSSTIRIELHTWVTFGGHHKEITTESHATILNGQYLVTHNHYLYSLTEQVVLFGEKKGYTAISLRANNGKLLLKEADLDRFTIVHEGAETLVLSFLDENGQGLFAAAGLPSAQFADAREIQLQFGDELAQVDWNGQTAHVDWVLVENISLSEEVPQFQVNNFPKKGCSGGGVFWNGIHIGNNWAKNIEEDSNTDEITRRYSIIALNSSVVAALNR